GPMLGVFEPPTTKDFVYGCWGSSIRIGGISLCFNFITLLVLLGVVLFVVFFYLGLRRPQIVPGRMQTLAEVGVEFVRENIALPMLGPDSARFMPLLATLFFAILFWNIFEVLPCIN